MAAMPSQREVRERQARSERTAAAASKESRHDRRRHAFKLVVAYFLVFMMIISLAGGLVAIFDS